jgi:hypothetical protein
MLQQEFYSKFLIQDFDLLAEQIFNFFNSTAKKDYQNNILKNAYDTVSVFYVAPYRCSHNKISLLNI